MNESTLMVIREVSHCEGSCVKDLIVNSYVKGAIVRLICEGSYCEAHNVPAGGVCTFILFHRPRWGSVHPHFIFQAPLGSVNPIFIFQASDRVPISSQIPTAFFLEGLSASLLQGLFLEVIFCWGTVLFVGLHFRS